MKDDLENIINSEHESPPGVNELSSTESDMVTLEFKDVVESAINETQFNILQGRTPKKYIKSRPGKGGKRFSYVPHGYVTAVLNKAFGFDWDFELIPVDGEKMWVYMKGGVSGAKQNASMLVHGRLTVRIRDHKGKILAEIVKTSTGEKEEVKGMSWGSMIKSAESDAFKKAASRLGVALDLYWKDADEDYIPAEKLSADKQKFVDLFKKYANGKDLPSPPVLAESLAKDGYIIPLPEIAEYIALYNKFKDK